VRVSRRLVEQCRWIRNGVQLRHKVKQAVRFAGFVRYLEELLGPLLSSIDSA
jgi:hypothetical protein